MKLSKALLITIIAFSNTAAHASDAVNAKQFMRQKNWVFVENKGQLASSDIKYYGRQGGVSLFCKIGMISFVFTKVDKGSELISKTTNQQSRLPLRKPVRICSSDEGRFCRQKNQSSEISTNHVNLILVGSNPKAQIIPSDSQDYYENYYTAKEPEGIINAHTYKTIIYKNIYPHINLILHSGEVGMEYEFWVMPGGNANDIQIQWEGTNSEKMLDGGRMYHGFDFGNIVESSPISYLSDNANKINSRDNIGKKLIKSQFNLINNHIGFNTKDYDKSKTLVIDPTLVWATYYGGNDVEYGNGITTDGSGNVIITGETYSNTGIASSGAYQTSYADSSDAFIAKFSSKGQMLWSTYFGGSGYDIGCSIAADGMGNIYINGNTSSKTGIASPGAYQTVNSEIINDTIRTFGMFMAKFTASGARVWGTYFGVGTFATGNSIALDDSGNVFITGTTFSTSGIATSGTYQTSLIGGGGSFIAKFNSLGERVWGTYYNVGSNSIATDRSGNIFITGIAYNDTGFASSGAFQTVFGGGNSDALIAKFSPSGQRLWSTYYGGGGDDWAYCVASDNEGNAYITGQTTSYNGIASSGAWQSKLGGTFIAKFSPLGERVWGTYFGSKGRCVGHAITISSNSWVYIVGEASSDSGIATQGAYQQSFTGPEDAYIARFSKSGICTWGSLYGTFYTYASSITSDAHNNVYFTGYTFDTSLTTIGVYQEKFGGGGDAYIAKFNFTYKYDAGIAGFPTPIDTVCPGAQLVSATFRNYGNQPLDSVMIYWQVNGKAQTPVHWFGNLEPDSSQTINLGNYNFLPNTTNTITAYTSQPDGFNDSVPENDTASIVIKSQRPMPLTGPPQNICKGTTIVQLGAPTIPGRTYSWTSKPTGFISGLSNPIDSPKISTEYYLKETVSATGCTDSDSVRVNVVPKPNATFDAVHIRGYEYQFTATNPNYPGFMYHWNFGKSDTTSGYQVSHIYPQNGQYMVYLTISLPRFCTVIDSNLIVLNEPFSLNIYPNPFGLQTDINYILASPSHVKISLIDAIGKQIGTLVDKQLNPGEYDTNFNGEFWKTRPGMYFVMFQLDDKLVAKKIIQIDSIYH